MPGFPSKAIAIIKTYLMEHVDYTSEPSLIRLAAVLFAIASKLLVEDETARLPDLLSPPIPPSSLSEAIQRVSNLTNDCDALNLYEAIGMVLGCIEEQLSNDSTPFGSLPSATELGDFAELKELGLFGQVVHWWHGPTKYQKERIRRRAILEGVSNMVLYHPPRAESESSPPGSGPHPSQFLSRLSLYWNSNAQWPRLAPPETPSRGKPLIGSRGDVDSLRAFRIALCPIDRQIHPCFRVTNNFRNFQALGRNSFNDTRALKRHLEAVVREAAKARIHLIVLPELMISESLRTYLLHLLHQYREICIASEPSPPWGIVAGSFHFWDQDEDPDHDIPRNESCLFGADGDALLIHQKRGRFRVPRDRFALSHAWFPNDREALPANVREVVESIRHNGLFYILESQVGRLALAICADCIAAGQTNLKSLLKTIKPDVLFIVSMSHETDGFEQFMEEMARDGVGTVFINAGCVCDEEKQVVLAGANLALPEPRGAPPTRVRWRSGSGDGTVEVRYYRAQLEDKEPSGVIDQPGKQWQKVELPSAENGLSWLEENDKRRLGLVLDLGAHWKWTRENMLND